MRKTLLFIWDISKIILIALVIVVPIRYFLFQPFLVQGQSMEPNFQDGDYLIIDEISYRFGDPERGDVVVFNYPHNPAQKYIKRIIGLPGETIEISAGKIAVSTVFGSQALVEEYLLGQNTSGDIKLTLAKDEYFVLGDHRAASADSRQWGPLNREYIIGKVFFRALPVANISKITLPQY